jgi:hypothetical protein
MVVTEVTEVIEVTELSNFDNEYVYDIGIAHNEHKWFFANDILIHNSAYFSAWPVIKDRVKSGELEWDTDTAIALYDSLGDDVNSSFPAYMARAFHAPQAFGELIKCGREVVGSSGLFITKKRYAIMVVDNEGKRCDVNGKPGKVKAMGLDLKRSDTPVVVQNFLKDILDSTLVEMEEGRDAVIDKVLKFKLEFTDLPAWEKGSPKRINNLTKYTALEIAAQQKGLNARLPGHVRAGLNYNNLRKLNGDNFTTPIIDGSKAVVCKLKDNPMGITSVARPTDENNIPQWFKDLPFDEAGMTESVVTQKIENLLGVLGWDLSIRTNTSNTFGSLFEF